MKRCVNHAFPWFIRPADGHLRTRLVCACEPKVSISECVYLVASVRWLVVCTVVTRMVPYVSNCHQLNLNSYLSGGMVLQVRIDFLDGSGSKLDGTVSCSLKHC